ncbi:MAG: hypothetical protein CM15mP102_04690 [Flavobacteriales bacterium]|nr:MAG: hypothetical protein CM15mP102_04690 [Flavobacteriales bacterium]
MNESQRRKYDILLIRLMMISKTIKNNDIEKEKWKYQRYMQDYLATISSVDDNVGRVLDYLEEQD